MSNEQDGEDSANTVPWFEHVETETWMAWLDGHKDDAVTFEVPVDGMADVAQLGADALGVDVSSLLNVCKA